MARDSRVLFTIGYEGRTVEELLTRLKSAGVALLVDVRYRPQSRKPGFSRTKLGQFCESAGIGYVHYRELGTPPEMMRRYGVGGYDSAAFAEYRRYVRGQYGALQRAGELVTRTPCCLLCYEADAQSCHRRVVAEELGRLTAATIIHL